ncbi:MAG: hypothetical protein ACK4S4_08780 [Pyrinomonadaceae bacterium]
MDTKRLLKAILSAGLFAIACPALSIMIVRAQSSTTQSNETGSGNYTVRSSVEVGYRGIEINGDALKFKSDLNYKAGVRIFDSSFLIDDKTRSPYKLFDTAFMSASGWGADPTGSFRLKMDKSGIYKFDSNVRRVRYFNNLNNFALRWSDTLGRSEHQANTLHHFGDFDLTIRPESETLRVKLGYSFNNTSGPGTWTLRFPSSRGDEFQVSSDTKNRSHDLRAGVEGKLLGFNLGVMYGRRSFTDKSRLFLDTFSPGNNQTDNIRLNSMTRRWPTRGNADWGNFFIQRTFAKVFDLTGRFVYSESRSKFDIEDMLNGRNSANDFVDLDLIQASGVNKRPQARGDIGSTYRVTDDFRISNTFTFDQFSIGGANNFIEAITSRTSAGVNNSSVARTYSWRTTSYRRFSNLLEGDYQVNRAFAFNLGWRYTQRKVGIGGIDTNLITLAVTLHPLEEHENTTNTLIVGTKIKPTKNWSVYADLERGQSDSVFTRLANNDYWSFRVRSRAATRQFALNLSATVRNNDNPGTTVAQTNVPSFESIARTRSRYFSGSFDWTPRSEFSLSTGYTYNHVDSNVDIIVPVGPPVGSTTPSTSFYRGLSQYFVRDSYFFFDVTARPVRRVSFYASYRINDDRGQGDRVPTAGYNFISSYPLRYQTPEARLAIRLTKNVDWNVGYQYYDYKEKPVVYTFLPAATPSQFLLPFNAQNYNAHLPYTSIRIHWGAREDAR